MRNLIILITLGILPISAISQTNWKELLRQDFVQIQDDKLTMVDYFLLKGQDEMGNPIAAQVKMYAQAPNTGFISRDNFVSFATMVYLPILLAMGGEYEQLEEALGTPDVEINLFMGTEGIQIEVKDNTTNTTNRNTMTWASMFGEQ